MVVHFGRRVSYCIYKSLNYEPIQNAPGFSYLATGLCECFNDASLEIVEQSSVALLKLLH